MGAGDPAGGADAADDVALGDALAEAHGHRAHMGIDRGQAVAVVEHHRAAGIEQVILGQGDHAVGRGAHR